MTRIMTAAAATLLVAGCATATQPAPPLTPPSALHGWSAISSPHWIVGGTTQELCEAQREAAGLTRACEPSTLGRVAGEAPDALWITVLPVDPGAPALMWAGGTRARCQTIEAAQRGRGGSPCFPVKARGR